MVSFGHIVYTYCGRSANIIGLACPIVIQIISYTIINIQSLIIGFLVIIIVCQCRHFCPDVIFVIHVLARGQFIDFHLFVIIGTGVGIIDLYGNQFRIQLLIGIGFIPADGFLRFLGMGEFPRPIPGTQHHIFRLLIHPGIAGLGILLNGRDLVVLAHNQVALGIVSSIGIVSLSRICIPIIFNFNSSRSRRIIGIGCRCMSPVRDGKERCRQDKGCQDGGFSTTSAAAAAYMAIVMALGQF